MRGDSCLTSAMKFCTLPFEVANGLYLMLVCFLFFCNDQPFSSSGFYKDIVFVPLPPPITAILTYLIHLNTCSSVSFYFFSFLSSQTPTGHDR